MKGAPESILDRCTSVLLEDGNIIPMDDDIRDEMIDAIAELSSNALRCIGLAYNSQLNTFNEDEVIVARERVKDFKAWLE